MEQAKNTLNNNNIKERFLRDNNNIIKGDKLNSVQATAQYLAEILSAKESSMPVLYKFSWAYDKDTLTRLAGIAKESDKNGTPIKLFVWLVREELGYEKSA